MGLRDLIPTKEQLFAQALAIWRKHRPDDDTGPLSYIWLHIQKEIQLWHGVHQTAARMMYALHPKWTWGQWLEAWLYSTGRPDGQGDYGLIKPKAAYGGEIDVAGTSGASLNGDEQLQLGAYTFELTEAASWSTDETKSLGVKAITKGQGGNLEVGQTMTFINPPAGITAEATVSTALDHGANLESEDAGRDRLRRWGQNGAVSGNCAHIREVVEGIDPANFRCYVYPQRYGAPYGWGTVDIAVLQRGESGTARFITAAQQTQVWDAIKAQLPYQVWKDIRILTVAEEDTGGTDLELTYELSPTAPESAYADFNAWTFQAKVSAYTESTKTIVADVSCTDQVDDTGISVGARLHIDGHDVECASVESTYAFTLTTWPWGAGSGPGAVYIQSGGGHVDGVRAAEKDYFDTRGPERGSNADETDSDWDDTVRVDWVRKVAMDVSGDLLGATVDDIGGGGAADKSPTPSTTDTVKLVTLGKTVIWQKWVVTV